MKKLLIKNNWQLIFFNTLVVFIFIIFYGHFGNIVVDSFRETYIPSEIIKGQVLYKNIFCIYAPFSYLFNALLFLIFGIKLNVLYFAGLIATLGVLNLTFFISKLFMNKTYALSIVLFIISVSLLSPNVFNYFFPYSYGILYGLLFALTSIYCCLKNRFLLAYFMYSFAVCAKYEFILLLPILFYITRGKDLGKNILALLIPIILCLTPLFISGLNFNDIITSFDIVIKMSSSKTLAWFYSIMGLSFRWELIPIYLINFVKILIPFLFIYYFKNLFIIFLATLYFYYATTPDLLIFIFPFILLLFVKKFFLLKKEKKIVIWATILISTKVFFAEIFLSYGVFFIPFALISVFILVPRKFKRTLFIVVLICALNYGIKNAISLSKKNIKIETTNGIVYTSEISVKKLVEYVEINTKPNEKILVLPEGLVVNFLTNRISDDKFYSLIPLYVETFGEELIIGRLQITNPEYIVISNYNTSNYYYRFFGQDYAGKIYDYILKNYSIIENIDDNHLSFLVYKKL